MKSDVLIVSAFGRGHWLAAKMAENNLSVHLLDLTETMGRWTPEDWEGPFGLLISEEMTDLQKERLTEDSYLDSVDHGFTFWLTEGPLEMKGPISAYRFQQKGYAEDLKAYVQTSKLENFQTIRNMNFDKNWLAHFAHQLSANVFKNNSQGMDYGEPLPLLSSYSIRRVSRRGYQRGLDWVRSKKVHVTSASIEDLFLKGGSCQGLEIPQSQVLQADFFIWCLSSEESQVFTPRSCEKLFPKGPLQAQWNWLRYRVQLEPNDLLHSISIKFTLIDDIDLPWTHSNLCMVQKTSKEYDYDVWVKLPQTHCFQKASLEEMSQAILNLFQKKIPYCKPRLLDMPQDYNYDKSNLGPGLFPIFDEEKLKKLKRRSIKNVYFDGPEVWKSLEWRGQFRNQSQILQQIQRSTFVGDELLRDTY